MLPFDEEQPVELLTSVRVLLAHANACPSEITTPERASLAAMSALPHVFEAIDSYLDYSVKWTLESASKTGSDVLMQRLAGREWCGMDDAFRMTRFRHGVRQAAAAGNLPVLQWWATQYLPPSRQLTIQPIFQAAAENGHLHVIQWLHQTYNLFQEERTVTSLTYAHANIVYWMYEQNCPFWLNVSMDEASKADDLEFMEWLHAHGDRFDIEISERAVQTAAINGQVSILQWLHATYKDLCRAWMQHAGHRYGNLEVIEWLHEQYPEVAFSDPGCGLAHTSDLKILTWMVKNYRWASEQDRSAWISRAITSAAERGDLPTLQFLWKHREARVSFFQFWWKHRELDQWCEAVSRAACNGRFEIVRWLCANGAVVSQWEMINTASHGHLDILTWLHENTQGGCTVDAMNMAAANGHLAVVQWLHANRTEGCTTEAMNYAAANGHLSVVQWLHHNRSEGCTIRAMTDAATNGHLNVVRWLHENRTEGCTAVAMDYAAANGHLDVVKYLHANRSEGCTVFAMDGAAAHGHLEIVEWLHNNRAEGCTAAAIEKAAISGHLEIVKFLTTQRFLQCGMGAVHDAISKGQFAIQEWLLENDARSRRRSSVFQRRLSLMYGIN